jgi:superfamily II DNA/RNA helicase
VFVATKYAAEIVADKLRKAGLTAEPFHGELSQGKRTQVLADFKAERLQVVVATDVAARGLDIADLPVVVNYDLPRSTQDYTHRIGRTGRAGEPGLAVSFVSAATQAHFRLIEKRQAIKLTLETISGFEARQVAPPPSSSPDAPGNGGIKGRRPSKKDRLRAMAANQPKTGPGEKPG